jgi:hypothetical protein
MVPPTVQKGCPGLPYCVHAKLNDSIPIDTTVFSTLRFRCVGVREAAKNKVCDHCDFTDHDVFEQLYCPA